MSAVQELVNVVRSGFNILSAYRTGNNKQYEIVDVIHGWL